MNNLNSIIKTDIIKNSIANIISKCWSIIAIYIFIPFYINILGEEAYGLVSFFATLQSAMNILGLGLSNTLRREFAKNGKDDTNLIKYKLLKNTEIIYIFMGIIIIAVCFYGRNFIAINWFEGTSMDRRIISSTLFLMGISIALQFLTNLYNGCILGFGYQITANIFNICWSVLKNVGSLIVIYVVLSDVRVFYCWHIIADIIYLIVLRKYIMMVLKKTSDLSWGINDFKLIKSIFNYMSGIVIISIISLINRQIDKVIISKYMGLEELGAYNSTFLLAQLITIISSAISIALFSKYTNLFSKNQVIELKKVFVNQNKIISLLIVCFGIYISVYSSELLMFWTHSKTYFDLIKTASFFIVIGNMFLALQEIPYAFLLSQGNTKINVTLGICLMPFTAIGTFMSVKSYGLMGGAVCYSILMLISTLFYIGAVYFKYFDFKMYLKYLVKYIIVPSLVCLLIAGFSKEIMIIYDWKLNSMVIGAILIGMFNLLGFIISFKKDFISILMEKEENAE